MQKKTYIILAVVFFLLQITVVISLRPLAEYSWGRTLGETLIRIVPVGSLVYAVYGVLLIVRAHRVMEKIWPLIVASLLSGFWGILSFVSRLVLLFYRCFHEQSKAT